MAKLTGLVGSRNISSTTKGRVPVSGWSKAKARLDRAVAAIGTVAEFDVYDFRRTVRTNLGRLGVTPFIAEQVIGHTQAGVHKVYDLHRYRDEKHDALLKWEQRLRAIVGS